MIRAIVSALAFLTASGCSRCSADLRGTGGSAAGGGGGIAQATTAVLPSSVVKDVITFPNGELTLHGVVYKPIGEGPFPAVLWNHGSYDNPMVAFDQVGPVFVARGWVLFGPFRRGQGLSASAGPYIGDEIARAEKRGGHKAAVQEMVRLLTGDHLGDQLAGYAWLKRQPFVIPDRIAAAGNSFGGIETVLGTEREPYCAALDAAGAAQAWGGAPELQDQMMRAVRASRCPLFFFQAENDFDLTPSRALARAMRESGKTSEIKIYPPFGDGRQDGHNFAWRGGAVWAEDVFAFLERHCAKP
jgi:carboxymethylenebutenolidase